MSLFGKDGSGVSYAAAKARLKDKRFLDAARRHELPEVSVKEESKAEQIIADVKYGPELNASFASIKEDGVPPLGDKFWEIVKARAVLACGDGCCQADCPTPTAGVPCALRRASATRTRMSRHAPWRSGRPSRRCVCWLTSAFTLLPAMRLSRMPRGTQPSTPFCDSRSAPCSRGTCW